MKSGFFALLIFLFSSCGCTIVDPGNRGVKVHLGAVSTEVYPEGLAWHEPFLTSIKEISIRQQAGELKADEYSSDLQQVLHHIKVLYRIPEQNVVIIFQKYQTDVWNSLIEPRVQETMHELSAMITAENIVKQREKLKSDALKLVRQKIGDLVVIDDIVIINEELSKDLEKAIEDKMVQQQETAKAEFIKQKTKVEADTAAVKAQGEANAIKIRGEALKANPKIIDLQIVEKWNGVSPLVVGQNGANILMPMGKKE